MGQNGAPKEWLTLGWSWCRSTMLVPMTTNVNRALTDAVLVSRFRGISVVSIETMMVMTTAPPIGARACGPIPAKAPGSSLLCFTVNRTWARLHTAISIMEKTEMIVFRVTTAFV